MLAADAPPVQASSPKPGGIAWKMCDKGHEEAKRRAKGSWEQKKTEWQQRQTAAALAGMRKKRWEKDSCSSSSGRRIHIRLGSNSLKARKKH